MIHRHHRQPGQVLVVAAVLLGLVLALSSAVLGINSGTARATLLISRARLLTEAGTAGIERALWCLNHTGPTICGGGAGSSYPGETFSLGSVFTAVTVTAINADNKTVTVNAVLAGLRHTERAQVSRERYRISMPYGVHVGSGGLTMESGATVNGDLFSNGDVYGDKKVTINGAATVASTTLNKVTVNGTARAQTISNSAINGDAYYQTLTKTTVTGNKFPGSPNPTPVPLALTDAIIAAWKKDAQSGGAIIGDYAPPGGVTTSLGPIEITGNLSLQNNQVLNLTGTVYVHGLITIDNNATIRLDSSYGSNSGVILSDGPIHLKNNGVFQGAGPESFLMILTTATGGGHHDSAIDLHNNATGAIFYAKDGFINLHNNVVADELSGNKIHLSDNAVLNYDLALQNAVFTSTAAGRWTITPGTRREIVNP